MSLRFESFVPLVQPACYVLMHGLNCMTGWFVMMTKQS